MTDQDWVTDEVVRAIIDAGNEQSVSFSSLDEMFDDLDSPE